MSIFQTPWPRQEQRSPPPYITLLVVGTIVVAPYVLVRGRLTALRRDIMTLHSANATLRQELRKRGVEADKREGEQHQRVLALLEGAQTGIDGLHAQTRETQRKRVEAEAALRAELRAMRHALTRLEADGVQRDHARAEWERLQREDLRVFLRDHQQTRIQLSAIREIGSSLADIAAFMHEVELQEGYVPRKQDGRGIERIRQLAKKLQELPVEAAAQLKLKQSSPNETKTASTSNSGSTSSDAPRES